MYRGQFDRVMTEEDKQKFFTREGAQNNPDSTCYKCPAKDCNKECPVSNPDGILGLKLRISILQDKLHRRNQQINELKKTIKILGEGLNAIRDAFYDTKQTPQVFIGNVEAILNATKNKL